MSALVIAGIMVMHVLGGHDGGGSEPMAMAPAGVEVVGTGMTSMNMSPTTTDQRPAGRAPRSVVAGPPVAVASSLDAATDMSDMSCCVLFLITSAALVLLALWTVRSAGRSAGWGGALIGATSRWRGPPAAPPSRFSLCVLRV